jgi:hypothetical protein
VRSLSAFLYIIALCDALGGCIYHHIEADPWPHAYYYYFGQYSSQYWRNHDCRGY